MKNLLLAILLATLFACNSKSDQEKTKTFNVELNINKVVYYGDTINFNTPQNVMVKPNSGDISLIELGTGTPFGVQYFVSELITGSEKQLLHNAVFFEQVDGKWINFNGLDHREKFKLNEETPWVIGVSNEGDTYFNIDFTYKVKEN
jgi:hypothetical protein